MPRTLLGRPAGRAARAPQPDQRDRGQRRLGPAAGPLRRGSGGCPAPPKPAAQRRACLPRSRPPGPPAGLGPARGPRERPPRASSACSDSRVLAGAPYARGGPPPALYVTSGRGGRGLRDRPLWRRAGVAGPQPPPRLILVTGAYTARANPPPSGAWATPWPARARQDPDHLRRPARAAPARDRRRAAGPRPLGHPGHPRLDGRAAPTPRSWTARSSAWSPARAGQAQAGLLDIITSGTKADPADWSPRVPCRRS